MNPKHRPIIYTLAAALFLVALALITYWAEQSGHDFEEGRLWRALFVGIIAQLVDGALGMAYGVTATTFLLSTGVPALTATASVHISEIFTTAASGLSHWHRGNVDRRLFLRLLLPGIIGALTGVALVTRIDSEQLKPWMAGYLFIMGLYLIYRAFRAAVRQKVKLTSKKIAPLALFGAFMDAVGGGGWGPIVTTTLLGSGHEPRKTIGSVNAAEFFITLATGVSFAMVVGLTYWETTAGLIIGGFIGAPLAVLVVSKLKPKHLMLMVGILICALSALTIYRAL